MNLKQYLELDYVAGKLEQLWKLLGQRALTPKETKQMNAIAALVANLIERAFGSKPNTIMTLAGVIALLSGIAALPQMQLFVPVEYQPYLIGASAFCGALAGFLGYGAKPQQALKALFVALLLGGLLLSAAPVRAQSGMLSTQATASAIRWQGAWGVGTEESQSFPLVYWGAQKGNVFSLGAREILAPSFGWNIYGVLGNYQPDISKLIAKTTFNPDQFNLSIDMVGGVATLPDGTTKPAVEGRLNVNYALTPNTALTGAYAGGGMIGLDRFGVVSAGFQYIFGAGNSKSMAMKRLRLRRAVTK